MTAALKPFSIGNIEIPSPFVLAPLAGYSDGPYRRICRMLGAPYCATEMMLDRSLLASGKLRRRLLDLAADDHPIAGQLLGSEPSEMAGAAQLLCEKGFDVVDVNFACPARKVQARGRGGALMKDPARAVAIVRAVLGAVDRPVTLKMRSGYSAAAASRGAFWRIADEAFAAGVAAICVHGRTVDARYLGPADWDFLVEVRRRYGGCTIMGSGDVRTPARALRMLRETGVDAVTVARGAIGNPWFFRQVADLAAGAEPYRPSLAEQRRIAMDHFVQACELYGPARGTKIMRKHCIKYSRLHDQPKRVRMAFVDANNARQWQQVLDEFYPVG